MKNVKKETIRITLPPHQTSKPPNTGYTLFKHFVMNPFFRKMRAERGDTRSVTKIIPV